MMFYNFLKLFVCMVCIGGTGFEVDGKKFAFPISNRSYQLPVYTTQGVQYSLYPTVPIVPITGQVGVPATPIANVLLQQQTEYKPIPELSSGTTFLHATSKPSVQKIKYKTVAHVRKRPTPYVNYIFPAAMKSYSVAQNPKISIVKSGVDGADSHYQQTAQSVYQTAFVPAYTTLKAVEYPKKLIRIPSKNVQTYYRRVTGPVHRQLLHVPKKTYVSGHSAEDHFRYYPLKHYSYSKALPVITYASPSVLTSTESPVFITTKPVQEASQTYFFNVPSKVKFPSDQEQSLTDNHQTAPGEITRAFIRHSEISNHDSTLPIKIPKKKSYPFEGSKLLKNSNSLQFEQDDQKTQKIPEEQENTLLQTSYSSGHPFAVIPVLSKDSLITTSSPVDIYNMAETVSYQNNNLMPDQDLAGSKTVKIPVAIIRGAHDLKGVEISGYSTARPDMEMSEPSKRNFKPSKKVSDWIPMSKGVSHETVTASEAEKYPSKKYHHQVEEIISGKIPREFSPNLSALRTGTMTSDALAVGDDRDVDGGNIEDESTDFRDKSSSPDGRRQNVVVGYVDSLPSTASDNTYNHVVSSVIKFSR